MIRFDAERLGRNLQDIEPNFLDRVIGYVSPRRALARMHARARIAIAASYTGARSDRRSMKEWGASVGSANADTLPELPTLRARSRDLVRNAPIAGGAINTVAINVVGGGLRLQPKLNREILGLSDEEAEEWERQAAMVWRAWSESTGCDITRIDDFAGLQDLAFRSVMESGDLLVVRRSRPTAGDVLGLKVQLVESDRICNPDRMLDTERLAGGVEIDSNGAPVRYHVLNRHPGDYFLTGFAGQTWSAVPARGRQSGERLAILLYHRTRSGQVRGVPFLAPVIEPLKQLSQYSEAELMAAVIAGMFTIFVKTELGDDQLAALATESEESGTTTQASDYKIGYGSVIDLAPNEEVTTASPQRPNANFDPFVESVLRQIGVGLGLPFEVLIKHFTASYSAARAALLEAWKFYQVRRQWLAKHFCQPVYEWAISEAILRDMLRAPGFNDDPVVRAAYLRATWIGPAPGQIDPFKETSAAEKRIQIGISTIEEETASITGGDWEVKHAQRVKERKARLEGGLESEETDPSTGKKAVASPAGVDADADPDAEDAEEREE